MIDEIEIDSGFFNKIYFEVNEAWSDFAIRYIYIYGGSSSSKTWSICQRIVVYMLEGEDNNTYVFKKVSAKIDETIFAAFEKIIRMWELSEFFIIQKHYIECKVTGSHTRFSGLDDSDKVKGLEGYRKIYIDEMDQVANKDFKQLRKRLRGQLGQQIIGAFNPVSEMSYIKVDIFDNENWEEVPTDGGDLKQVNDRGDTIAIRTNYLYNIWIVGDGKGGGFIDTHTIADFERDRLTDLNYYNIYALGRWGKLRTGGEFYKQFDSNRHVGNFPYRDYEPLHVVFDENVVPYLTCNVFQMHDGNLRQIDEIMLEDPHNTLEHTCTEFMNRYGANVQGLFVYGDSTSRKQDSKMEKGQNFFKLIQKYLAKKQPILRVPRANPSVILSRIFVNNMMRDDKVKFDAKCRKSINDYQYCTEDSEGKVNKSTVRNKDTGQTYQEYGHASDALRYITTVMFINEYKSSMRK